MRHGFARSCFPPKPNTPRRSGGSELRPGVLVFGGKSVRKAYECYIQTSWCSRLNPTYALNPLCALEMLLRATAQLAIL